MSPRSREAGHAPRYCRGSTSPVIARLAAFSLVARAVFWRRPPKLRISLALASPPSGAARGAAVSLPGFPSLRAGRGTLCRDSAGDAGPRRVGRAAASGASVSGQAPTLVLARDAELPA